MDSEFNYIAHIHLIYTLKLLYIIGKNMSYIKVQNV